jgi:hypothetical protein
MGLGSPKMDKQFSWISFIDTLAGGDITKYKKIYKLSYEECLYKLLYEHHKDKYNSEINRRAQLQQKHRK